MLSYYLVSDKAQCWFVNVHIIQDKMLNAVLMFLRFLGYIWTPPLSVAVLVHSERLTSIYSSLVLLLFV